MQIKQFVNQREKGAKVLYNQISMLYANKTICESEGKSFASIPAFLGQLPKLSEFYVSFFVMYQKIFKITYSKITLK